MTAGDNSTLQRWGSRLSVGLSGHLKTKNCLRYEIAGSERAVAWNSEQPNLEVTW